MGARVQEALKTTIKVYLVLILLVLPLYMENGYAMIGNVKYRFFRNVTLFFILVTVILLAVLAVSKSHAEKRAPLFSGTDIMALCYGAGAVLSWCFSGDRYRAWWGAPGWYMGLLSQLMFVWIYFAVSRWGEELSGVLWAFFTGAVIVMALGILNRYVFDPLSVVEGLSDWDREHFLSTIGNQNWYCGYVSVASSVCLCFTCMEGRIRQAAGLAGSLLFFWTLLTQGSEGGYLIALAEAAVLLFWALEDRRRLFRFLRVMACCPAAALMGQYCIRFRGLVLVEDGSLGGFLFWRGWPAALAVLAVLLVLLYFRERKGCEDRLKSGRVKKAALWAAGALLVSGAAVILACQVWEGVWVVLGEKELLRITDSWGNGRGALWRISLGTYARGSFVEHLVGAGPDCFSNAAYARYPVNEILHATGKWETALYANAHNEWLNILVNQGILGLVSYGGIFATLFIRLWKSARRDPSALLGILAVSGYCVYGVVSFQQTVSTPLVFAVLGISEAALRKGRKVDLKGENGYTECRNLKSGMGESLVVK